MTKELAQQMAALQFDACLGTVRDRGDFNATLESEALRKAMKGLGTTESTIIEITAKRTRKQRMEIAKKYTQLFGRELLDDLKSEISGDFLDLTLDLYTPAAKCEAKSLHDAMDQLGTNEGVLIEILTSRSNAEIKEIKAIYKKEYKNELEKDVAGETSGDFKRLLVALLNVSRDDSRCVDQNQAISDANTLYKAGEERLGTDESTFIRIMCSRSYPQLRATFEEYQKIAKKDIIESIKGEFSGDAESGLIAIVQNVRCAPVYFASRLHQSMKGAGTNESLLNRIIAIRSEIDMVQIKEVFQTLYKSSLEEFIRGDTRGDYEKLLLDLIS